MYDTIVDKVDVQLYCNKFKLKMEDLDPTPHTAHN
jgi:hypothetical protein